MEPRRRAAPESPTLGPAHDVGVIKFSTLPHPSLRGVAYK